MSDDAHIDAHEVLLQLNAAANALDTGSRRLVDLTREFEGHVDENGQYQPGPQLRWLEAVGDALDDLAATYEEKDKRPPAQAVLERRAEKRAKDKHPDLWADYHRLKSEVGSMQRWLAAKKQSVSARQSVLKAEGVLAGVAR